jgi:hypothetical protein
MNVLLRRILSSCFRATKPEGGAKRGVLRQHVNVWGVPPVVFPCSPALRHVSLAPASTWHGTVGNRPAGLAWNPTLSTRPDEGARSSWEDTWQYRKQSTHWKQRPAPPAAFRRSACSAQCAPAEEKAKAPVAETRPGRRLEERLRDASGCFTAIARNAKWASSCRSLALSAPPVHIPRAPGGDEERGTSPERRRNRPPRIAENEAGMSMKPLGLDSEEQPVQEGRRARPERRWGSQPRTVKSCAGTATERRARTVIHSL